MIDAPRRRANPLVSSGGDLAAAAGLSRELVIDDFARRVFATAAAAGNRQMDLHLVQRRRAAIHDFADLAIADGMTHANVHKSRLAEISTLLLGTLKANANDCQ